MPGKAWPRTVPPPMMLVWADVYPPGNRQPRWLIGESGDVRAVLEEAAASVPYGVVTARIYDIASYS